MLCRFAVQRARSLAFLTLAIYSSTATQHSRTGRFSSCESYNPPTFPTCRLHMSDLAAYLASVRSTLQSNDPKDITVVLGNESADLDSVVSSMVHGFAVAQRSEEKDRLVVPVVAIPRRDFVLRTESIFWLKQVGIESRDLVFADEFDVTRFAREASSRIVLVDHNKLALGYESCGDKVWEIVDHHKDEGLYGSTVSPGRRTIEVVGSAATLVAEQILEKTPSLMNEVIAQLVCGVILIDTSNLNPTADRATAKDHALINKLKESYLPAKFDLTKAFEDIKREKFNQSNLSTYDLLRRDYKQWNLTGYLVGIASVGMPVMELFEGAARGGVNSVVEEFERYCATNGLDQLLVMLAYPHPSDGFARDLVVYLPEASRKKDDPGYVYLKEMHAQLETSTLELKGIDPPLVMSGLRLYKQGNVSCSRKQLQPLLAEILSQKPTK